MGRPFLTEAGREALGEAARSLETRSSVEVVVTVRRQAAAYLHADLGCGIAAGVLALAFLLYSPMPFPTWSFLVEPLLVGGLAGFACSRSPALRRLLTPRAWRRAWVERAARATFQEKGIHLTSGRTGLLAHVGLLEREVVVVADAGIADAVPDDEWARAVSALETAVRRGADAERTAPLLRALGDVLAAALPSAADDVNELADEVCAP